MGSALAALNGVLTIVPLVLVWFVLRDFVAVAPRYELAADATLWAWLAFAVAVVGALCYFAGLMLTHTAAFRVAANMRKACLAHVAKVPLGYFDANASGRLRRIIDGCAGQTEDVIAHKMPDFIASCTAPVAFLVAMFLFDWVMGLVCLIPVAVSLFAMWWMMGRDVPEGGRFFMQRYQEALNRMSTAATEYVRGIPVVKVFQQTVHSFKAFHAAIIDYRDMATQYVNFCRLPQVVQLVAINGTFAVLVPAAILLAASAGDFARFLTDFLFYVVFSAFTTTVMSKIMYASEALMMAEDSVRRVNEILAVEPMEEVRSEAAEHVSDASVALRGVTFSYPGAAVPAVRDVTLEVPAGATVALVGPSGGGKSTLASLIPRFWDPQEGTVAVGGADVRAVPTAELMDTVAFVFQNDRLFKGTLADNIRMGRPDASDEEVRAAAEAAQCADIIAKFPEGLSTVVGSAGVYLSGGECQRIAFGPGHSEGRARGGARRGHGLRRSGERGAHPAGAGTSGRGQDGAHDRAPALHGGGRRSYRRGGWRRHRGARHPRRALSGWRPVRAAVGQLSAGNSVEDRRRWRPCCVMRWPSPSKVRSRCAGVRPCAPWRMWCSCCPWACSIW